MACIQQNFLPITSHTFAELQEELTSKLKKLELLEQGAQAIMKAAETACTELALEEPSAQLSSLLSLQARIHLPQPLCVLSSELRVLLHLYGLPIQVCCCSHTLAVSL
jgi:hypothetical protein